MNLMINTQNNMHYCYCLLLLILACTYDKVILLRLIDFITLNIWYAETTCPIDLKLTVYIRWAYRSLYTDFQMILKFYKNIEILNFKGHRYTFYGPVSIQIN